MTLAIILVLISYLMGSICSAVIVCSLFDLPDPRTEGSNNPGATNVLRIAGKQYAALVLLVDMLKGTLPVLLAQYFDSSSTVVACTVLAAVLGHMYPVFFKFKGGKGVATAIGALLGFHFILGVMVVATWLLVVNFSRYSSLASIISITLSPLYTLLLTHDIDVFPPLCIMAILILFKHKNNIVRLIDGDEPKVFIKENVLKEIMEDSPKEESPATARLETKKPKAAAVKKKNAPKKIEAKAKETVAASTPEKATTSKAKKPKPKTKAKTNKTAE